MRKYNKILSKPLGNFLAEENTTGSAKSFISNHLNIAKERAHNIRISDIDNDKLIKDNIKAINEYDQIKQLPAIEKIFTAIADLENYIIMNTAKGLADIKIDKANNTINGVKREWLVARIAFPTDDPKNQFIRVVVGAIDSDKKKFIDRQTKQLYSMKDPIIEKRATELINAEIDKRMNGKGTLDELISSLKNRLSI